jgi:DNA-binding transcriptional regulator YiaG
MIKKTLDKDSSHGYTEPMIMRTARDLKAWLASQDKMTQVELARRVGRSKFTVNKWATGDIKPLPPYLSVLLERIEQDRIKEAETRKGIIADARQRDMFDAVPKRKRGRPRKS